MFDYRSFLHALKWAYATSFGDKVLSAVFYLVLAGVLGPRDFGIVSLAMIYVGFLQLFLDQGFAAALIQRRDLIPAHFNAVFWMDLVLSVGLFVISIFFSRAWGFINHSPEVAAVALILSVSIIMEALTVVQTAILRREMNFRGLSIRSNASNSISGVVGIALVWWGAGVWALVCQVLLRDLIALILLWRLSTWRPSFTFSWTHLKELMGFSTQTFAAQLAIFTNRQVGSIVLGIFIGPAAVGLYGIAAKAIDAVVTMATASIQVVSLPQFSRLQNQPLELKKSVILCIRLGSAATLPALAGLAALSYSVMAIIGPKWVPAAGAMIILSITAMGGSLTYFTAPLMQALGKPHQVAVLEWVSTLIGSIILVTAGWLVRNSLAETQVLGIAVARLIVAALFVIPVSLYFLLKLANLSLREFIISAGPSILAAVSVATSIGLLKASERLANTSPVPLLVVEVAIGGFTGVSALVLSDRKLRGFAVGVVEGLIRRILRGLSKRVPKRS